jgi:ketosteroid isomerase-like protein
MSHPNAAVAERFLRAAEANDIVALQELFAPEVKHWIPPSSSKRSGLPQPIDGREAVLALFEGSPKVYAEVRFEVLLLVANDNGAAVWADMSGSLANGREFENRYGWFFRIADGRITEIVEQLDTADAYEYLGW